MNSRSRLGKVDRPRSPPGVPVRADHAGWFVQCIPDRPRPAQLGPVHPNPLPERIDARAQLRDNLRSPPPARRDHSHCRRPLPRGGQTLRCSRRRLRSGSSPPVSAPGLLLPPAAAVRAFPSGCLAGGFAFHGTVCRRTARPGPPARHAPNRAERQAENRRIRDSREHSIIPTGRPGDRHADARATPFLGGRTARRAPLCRPPALTGRARQMLMGWSDRIEHCSRMLSKKGKGS